MVEGGAIAPPPRQSLLNQRQALRHPERARLHQRQVDPAGLGPATVVATVPDHAVLAGEVLDDGG